MIKSRNPRRLLALSAHAAISLSAAAVGTTWTFNGSGNWTTASNWFGGVPAVGMDVFINHSDSVSRTVTYDYAGAPVTLGAIAVNNAGSGTNVVSQATNTMNLSSAYFGGTGDGCLALSGGTFNVTGSAGLSFGSLSTGIGIGTVTGGLLNVSTGSPTPAQLNVGYSGAGTVVHSNGTVVVGSASSPGNLLVARGTGSTGTYLLGSAGVLQVYGTEIIGGPPTTSGNFVQSGGSNSVLANTSSGFPFLGVGVGTTSSGRYVLSGGTLTVMGSTTGLGQEHIGGSGGTGVFEHSGGNNLIGDSNHPGVLYVGRDPGSNGTYRLSGTGSLSATEEFIGGGGNGTFEQSGGLHTANVIGLGSGIGFGRFLLSGGSIITNRLTVGDDGTASFNQSGGSLLTGSLRVAEFSGSVGTATLSDGTLTLFGAYISGSNSAAGGMGILNVQGGVLNSLNSTMKVWNSGEVRFTGGTFSAGDLQLIGGGKMFIGAGTGRVLRTTSIAIESASGSKLESSDNSIIVDYLDPSPVNGITALAQIGYTNGTWIGNGLTSSSAATASTTSTKTALGIAEATDLFTVFPATFSGQSVDNTTVLIRYTLSGDANLDRTVNGADFNLLASNFGGSGKRWYLGDFTFDGSTNSADFNVLASNFGKTLASGPGAAVPEPGLAGVSALAGILLTRRTRR